MASSDAGRSWISLGAPATMAMAWDPTDPRRLVAVGMDGGRTWSPLSLPAGTSAVTLLRRRSHALRGRTRRRHRHGEREHRPPQTWQ
jgi:hypothetical protein